MNEPAGRWESPFLFKEKKRDGTHLVTSAAAPERPTCHMCATCAPIQELDANQWQPEAFYSAKVS